MPASVSPTISDRHRYAATGFASRRHTKTRAPEQAGFLSVLTMLHFLTDFGGYMSDITETRGGISRRALMTGTMAAAAAAPFPLDIDQSLLRELLRSATRRYKDGVTFVGEVSIFRRAPSNRIW
jgi:hypothetical protein